MSKTSVLGQKEQTDPAPEIDAELLKLLASCSPEEQRVLADLIRRFKENEKYEHRSFDAVSLIHQFLKADPKYTDFTVFENLNTIKGPQVIKEFPDAETFPLPRDFLPMNQPLDMLLEARTSKHDFGPEPLTQQMLSTFLHYTYGVKRYIQAYNIKKYPVRQAPSAGGLQPVELYLVVNSVEGLPKGLYHYHPIKHALELLDRGNMRGEMVRCTIYSEFVMYAPVICILTCNMDRVIWKYNDRSYRFVHVDTGVLTQNMYLVGTALNLNTCPLAAFYDDKINELLQVDGLKEFTVLLYALGNKPFGGSCPV